MAYPGWGTGPVERITPAGAQRDHFIVCGGNALAHRLVVELVEQYDVQVVAIVPGRDLDHAPQIAKILGGGAVIALSAVTEDALRAAEVATARGIALVDGDDQTNIHAALRAQALNPGIRIVLRMFNQRLGGQIQQLFPNCAALSGSATAAPAFVDAALRRPGSVQIGGRFVCVAQNTSVRPDDYLCTIADQIDPRDPAHIRMLPNAPGAAPHGEKVPQDVLGGPGHAVLRFLDGEPDEHPRRLTRLRWRLVDLLRYFTSAQIRRVLIIASGAVFASFCTLWYLDRPFGWALYTTLLDMAGAAQPDTFGQPSGTGGVWQRVAQVVATFCGITFIPVVTAIMLDNISSGRHGSPRQPSAGVRGHVVVVGLGNVGIRVAALLTRLGVSVVCIESNPNARGIADARSLNLPVLVGEGSLDDLLRRARVHTSRALLAVTGDDAFNLEAALEARAIDPGVRVVLRLFDDDFATHVYRTFANAASRSVSYLAAPEFAAALMGREVLGTLSVYRQVVLMAEFTAAAGSDQVGRSLEQIEIPGELRVVAVCSGHGHYRWRPEPGLLLKAGDRYVVAATRSGLGRHTGRAA